MKTRIISDMKKRGEWGKFFPLGMAYCGYNFSLASIFFPETRKYIEEMGGMWEEPADVVTNGLSNDALPDRIDDAADGVSSKQLVCPITKRKFNIAPQELEFCRAHGIPLPHYHFDVRTLDRLKLLAVVIPTQGVCDFCKAPITHFYPPEWNYQKIVCVECYQQHVS